MTDVGELPFKLEIEQAHPAGKAEGTVLVGRFVQGSIHIGDRLELVDSGTADETATQLTCATYSLLCEVDWDPSRSVLLGVTVHGIEPEQVMPGSILRAAGPAER
jgi:hypothetical protein